MLQDHIRTMGKHALACGKLEKEFQTKFEEELKGVQSARHEYETSVKIFNNTTVERAKTQSSNLLGRVDHAIRDLPDNAVSRITAAGKTISQTEVKVNELISKYEKMEKNRNKFQFKRTSSRQMSTRRSKQNCSKNSLRRRNATSAPRSLLKIIRTRAISSPRFPPLTSLPVTRPIITRSSVRTPRCLTQTLDGIALLRTNCEQEDSLTTSRLRLHRRARLEINDLRLPSPLRRYTLFR